MESIWNAFLTEQGRKTAIARKRLAYRNNQEAEGLRSQFPTARVEYVMYMRKRELWAALLFTDLVVLGA